MVPSALLSIPVMPISQKWKLVETSHFEELLPSCQKGLTVTQSTELSDWQCSVTDKKSAMAMLAVIAWM